jgi:hypothetical protein
MGVLAGVPIEPPEQTKLLDACVAQAGIIGGGVPGGTVYFPHSHTHNPDLVLVIQQPEVMTPFGCSYATPWIVPRINDPPNGSSTSGVITKT